MAFPRDPADITVDWLTGILDAEPGDIQAVAVDFVGDAIGNTSDVYFIRLTTRDGAGLPASLVAKMIPRFDGALDVCKVLKLFEREIEVYRHIASPSGAPGPVRAPKLVWSDYDPQTSLGFMLMEDCSGCRSLDQTAPVPSTIEQLHRIVEAAGSLHARWWNLPDLPPCVMTVGHPVRTAFFTMVRDGWRDLLAGGPGSEAIPKAGHRVATCFADNLLELVEARWPTDGLTVTHLDFRVDNIFFDDANDEPVIFDWQGTSIGRGAYDLAYLLSTGYAPEFRRRHEREVLRRYHETLRRQGVTDYPLDRIEADYRFGMAFSLWVVPFTAILDLSSERGQRLVDKIIGGIFTAIDDLGADAALEGMFSG